MSLFFARREAELSAFVPPANSAAGGLAGASPASSLRVGAVWACLRLRADLISTMPVDVFRKVDGRAVEVPKPPIFVHPSGGQMLWNEWMYATQMDLDRYGNAFGQVVAFDGAQRPAQIVLSDATEWSVQTGSDGAVVYRRRGVEVDPALVWHERQHVVPGLPVGLSPIAFSAWTTGHYLSAQQFALDWFDSGASPSGVLKNEAKTLSQDEAATMKARFRAAVAHRDVFVAGKDWTFTPAAGAASDAKFLDAMKATTVDVCRFYGVPGDMIDAETSTGSITYANVTQRNLQLLVINIGPAVTRRELTFSDRLVAAPRFVKLNADALLRMDSKTKLEMLGLGVDKKIYTRDEARGIIDLPPLTDEQIAKEKLIEGRDQTPTTKTGVPA